MALCCRLIIFLSLLAGACAAQTDPWIRYADSASGKFGYKDKKGNVKMHFPLRSMPFADTFYDIAAVDVPREKIKPYYILRNGKQVGVDSLFEMDYEPDCENEGMIRFKNKKNRMTGFLDKNGSVAIPAIYSEATPFYNGISWVVANSRLTDSFAEHGYWAGGESILINMKNQVLLSHLKDDLNEINWYSMRCADEMCVDPELYVSVKFDNNKTYSFLRYDKEFEKWFYGTFLQELASADAKRIRDVLFYGVIFWSHADLKWKCRTRDEYLALFSGILQARVRKMNRQNTMVMNGDLINLVFNGKMFAHYKNACGKLMRERYPMYEVIRSFYKPNGQISFQEDYYFIRTDEGYKLVSISEAEHE